ncbi:tRNA (adenosine(37)-N6)-threonylcarbamoyltransferase complex ATPase subunit type 1 TsaE [Neobacillus drentensis]|uniref:tRNA (adenosine(37)-N6)-threonylcarbamoyltransferase complex ATPase subunit type 1 TsaE n=1 Tax=Neobacillus drentensis TaxID=220684 RepID=UPI000BF7D895|nr:tRNA (adenosine(37)-N6)-threonylcarbamoyltransferase complex ATPase subunit type 1 TsaE [Bacillus sp. AFS006103]
MNQFERITTNSEETSQFAAKLAGRLQPGDILALEGDLGAGKTTFTKGLAKGLEIKRTVNSPTFTIIKEYKGKLPLYHMDVYRMGDAFEDLGFDEYFEGEGVTVVEWAHLIEEQLPLERLTIFLYREEGDTRRMVFVPQGKRYEQLCKEIFS